MSSIISGEIVGQVFDGWSAVAAVSGIGAAVNGQVRTDDVRRFRTRDEGDQGNHIVHVTVTVKSRVGDLRRGRSKPHRPVK